MYKLRTKEKNETSDLGSSSHNNKRPFDTSSIILVDVDNKLPYGRGGGTNWNNTQYYHLILRTYAHSHAWYNTPHWCADLGVQFSLDGHMHLRGTETWENSFDDQKVISLVEDLFKLYTDNILQYLDADVKTNKQKTKFWSDKGFVFDFCGFEEELDTINRQKSTFKIIMADFWTKSSGQLTYFKDWDKHSGTIPAKFDVITKAEVEKLIRAQFLGIANHFLSQDFQKSPRVPSASDIIGMSKSELQATLNAFDNKTIFKSIIAK